jgi:hypothetical protein
LKVFDLIIDVSVISFDFISFLIEVLRSCISSSRASSSLGSELKTAIDSGISIGGLHQSSNTVPQPRRSHLDQNKNSSPAMLMLMLTAAESKPRHPQKDSSRQ